MAWLLQKTWLLFQTKKFTKWNSSSKYIISICFSEWGNDINSHRFSCSTIRYFTQYLPPFQNGKKYTRTCGNVRYFRTRQPCLLVVRQAGADIWYAPDTPVTYRRHSWDTFTAYVNYIYRRVTSSCPRQWPPACLRTCTEFNLAGRVVVVGCCQRFKYFVWTSSADATYSTQHWKLRQIDLHFAQIWVRRRSIADALRTHWNRSPKALSLATGDYVAGSSTTYENQARETICIACWVKMYTQKDRQPLFYKHDKINAQLLMVSIVQKITILKFKFNFLQKYIVTYKCTQFIQNSSII